MTATIRSRTWLALLHVGLAAAGVSACSDSSGGAKSSGAGGKGSTGGALRCGDFMTTADVMALGLDTAKYDENASQPNPGLGVLCRMGKVLTTIFNGDEFSTMVAGLDDAIMKGTLRMSDGASVGQESHWATIAPETEVIFLGTSGKHAANVTSQDAALVEKVATALDPKL